MSINSTTPQETSPKRDSSLLYTTPISSLNDLSTLPRKTLAKRWLDLYGSPPPPRLSRGLMIRAVAFRIQDQAFGGLKPSIQRKLAQTSERSGSSKIPSAPRWTLKPGTRLIREWQGVIHEVIVLEKGVQYRDKTWKSLSAVAREITGTRWSGPLFFDLKKNARA